MAALEKAPTSMATLPRRALLVAAPAGLLTACGQSPPMTASRTPKLDQEGLDKAIRRIAERAAPAALGVGLMNLSGAEAFTFNGERRFPMMSVFKLPLAAAVLSELDARRLSLGDLISISEQDLSAQYSPIATAWPGRRDYTVGELLTAIVVESDNTAADVLMKHIGGPGALTAWLTSKRLTEIRVDRYEREMACEAFDLASFRPEWRDGAAYAAARAAVPAARRIAAMRAFMADPRDTATPRGMLDLYQALDSEALMSPASTRLLLRLMAQNTRGAGRIRAGLPAGTFLAHRPGTSGVDQGLSLAHNDTALFTLKDKRSYALAVFLSGSTLDEAGRDAVIADVTRAAVKGVG